jgi:hypothetical protein
MFTLIFPQRFCGAAAYDNYRRIAQTRGHCGFLAVGAASRKLRGLGCEWDLEDHVP